MTFPKLLIFLPPKTRRGWGDPGLGKFCLGESQSNIHPNMCAKFGRCPTVMSEKKGVHTHTCTHARTHARPDTHTHTQTKGLSGGRSRRRTTTHGHERPRKTTTDKCFGHRGMNNIYAIETFSTRALYVTWTIECFVDKTAVIVVRGSGICGAPLRTTEL